MRPLADGDAGRPHGAHVLGNAVFAMRREVSQKVRTTLLALVARVEGGVAHDDGAGPREAGLLQEFQVGDESLLGVVAEDEVSVLNISVLAQKLRQALHPRLDGACQDLHLVLHACVLDDAGGDGREQRVHLDAHELAALGKQPADAQRAVAAVSAELDGAHGALLSDGRVEDVLADAPGRGALHVEVGRPELVHGGQHAVDVPLLDTVNDMHKQLALAAVHKSGPMALLAHLHDGADGLRVDQAPASNQRWLQ
mmetsp:Transcript_112129/g.323909  ORF Transcript_112129/g.323909 Transcript_112129/m.323909 type:complete len:254 (-) Transcript_112129:201-962(-)